MAADVEIIAAVVRAGQDYQGIESAKAGGPGYDFAATLIIRGDTAEIIGATGKLSPALVRQIEQALMDKGIRHARWDRYGANHAARHVKRTGAEG